ncbi:endonuclease/exonuclease/phosphatase family protein [Marinospirillum insulare]|uniref:EEP domain-containing protein n=1 Tax=Marinospirillum insulare TaxID=217169 RepID=A0ABQ6A0D7_9GAMM|nr:endonuclease/exonuclease/phosphatase family protein [Marinospirillum insulare]GLR64725.1 EEP domain-containing protein [Marinospirillum insulare]
MLKPTIACPTRFIHQQALVRGEEFGVLCWNTQKSTQNEAFQVALTQLLTRFPSQFLLFQEAKLSLTDEWYLNDWSYALASNIQSKHHVFGVLTASQYAFSEATPKLTLKREFGLATHKSYMVSKHPLPDKQSLLIINVHAINFVSSHYFLKELTLLKEQLLNHQGPLIVAGDFNVWSRQRKLYLLEFSRAAGLKQAYLNDAKNVKSYLNMPLDFIFYRGLWLKEAVAIKTKVSDHNPIYTRFVI